LIKKDNQIVAAVIQTTACLFRLCIVTYARRILPRMRNVNF